MKGGKDNGVGREGYPIESNQARFVGLNKKKGPMNKALGVGANRLVK